MIGIAPAIGPIDLGEDEIAVIVALTGAVSTLAGLIYRDLLKRLDRCEAEAAELRAASQALLESYRERDAAELSELKARLSQEHS